MIGGWTPSGSASYRRDRTGAEVNLRLVAPAGRLVEQDHERLARELAAGPRPVATTSFDGSFRVTVTNRTLSASWRSLRIAATAAAISAGSSGSSGCRDAEMSGVPELAARGESCGPARGGRRGRRALLGRRRRRERHGDRQDGQDIEARSCACEDANHSP